MLIPVMCRSEYVLLDAVPSIQAELVSRIVNNATSDMVARWTGVTDQNLNWTVNCTSGNAVFDIPAHATQRVGSITAN